MQTNLARKVSGGPGHGCQGALAAARRFLDKLEMRR
jgi:hypothetical protein